MVCGSPKLAVLPLGLDHKYFVPILEAEMGRTASLHCFITDLCQSRISSLILFLAGCFCPQNCSLKNLQERAVLIPSSNSVWNPKAYKTEACHPLFLMVQP